MEFFITYLTGHVPELAIIGLVAWGVWKGKDIFVRLDRIEQEVKKLHEDHERAEQSRDRIYKKLDEGKEQMHDLDVRTKVLETKMDK